LLHREIKRGEGKVVVLRHRGLALLICTRIWTRRLFSSVVVVIVVVVVVEKSPIHAWSSSKKRIVGC
jgi:hypothetical protein